jgi:putative ABC transport system ATP-binding protein
VTQPAAFELREVVAGPREAPILRTIDVDLPCDGITAIAGPSGSGKSTLLRLLNRLDDPTSGTIRWNGRPLTEWSPRELRRRVAMVFQRPPIFDGTVRDNFAVALADITTDRAVHVLEHVGLSADLLDRKADRLSGGEAQRMCFARALLTNPEVILADEPTAALDRRSRETVEELGAQIAADGVPIIWISHDTEQLRRLADHVLVLVDGRIAAFGHLDELDRDADEEIRSLIGTPS